MKCTRQPTRREDRTQCGLARVVCTRLARQLARSRLENRAQPPLRLGRCCRLRPAAAFLHLAACTKVVSCHDTFAQQDAHRASVVKASSTFCPVFADVSMYDAFQDAASFLPSSAEITRSSTKSALLATMISGGTFSSCITNSCS